MREPTAPAYYDRRATEYDDWYLGERLYADRERDGFAEELGTVAETLAALSPARTLDVACGTGFLTRHLRGRITGLDQSARMLDVARTRLPGAELVQGNALALPFPDDCFDRVELRREAVPLAVGIEPCSEVPVVVLGRAAVVVRGGGRLAHRS